MAYVCYILTSENSSRTYVGITNNLTRRLKQHNGECVGGAKYTKSCRPWKVFGYISGFGDNKIWVLQFEWRLKYLSRKMSTGSPIEKRLEAISKLLSMENYQGLEYIQI